MKRRLVRKPKFWLSVIVVYTIICQITYYSYHYHDHNPSTSTQSSSSSLLESSSQTYDAHQSANHTKWNSTSPLTARRKRVQEIGKDKNNNEPQPTTTTTRSSLTLGPIFFNIFVPTNNIAIVRRILKEQFTELSMMRTSNTNATPQTTTSIEYTLISQDDAFDIEIQQICNQNERISTTTSPYDDHAFTCHQRKYVDSGNEVETLQELWEYCEKTQQTQNHHHHGNDVLVTYLHNKGSFHPSESNERARRMGTKAALECRLLMLEQPQKCNICTSSFHIFPQYLGSAKLSFISPFVQDSCCCRFALFPLFCFGKGLFLWINLATIHTLIKFCVDTSHSMWTARCSYIQGLHPPNNYSNMLEFMYDTTLNHSQLSHTKYACLRPTKQSPNYLGLGRYAYERWPFSHPKVKPCDVVEREGDIDAGEFPQTWQPNFRRAPHSKPKQVGIQFGPYKTSFARLAGRLFEWEFMYGLKPTNHSWIWKWYSGYEVGAPALLKNCTKKEKDYGWWSTADGVANLRWQ